MLIRQKAGWRLHHQAYLWPRRSRPSPLSSISTSLLLPRRRRSGASSGGSAAQSGDDSSSSPLSLRSSSSSSGSYVEGEDLSPSSPTSTLSSIRRDSSDTVASSSPSSTSSSSVTSSPRKRKASGSIELDTEELFSLHTPKQSAGHSRRSSSSSDLTFELSSLHLPPKRTRRSSGSIVVRRTVGATTVAGDNVHREDINRGSVKERDGVPLADSRTFRFEQAGSTLRPRRDTRSGDLRGVEPASSHSNSGIKYCSNLKGSNVSNCISNSSGNNNNNNNHLPHCGSNYSTSSLKDSPSIRESSCRSGNYARTTRMGVLCTEKHDMGERCECEAMSANSPRPASVHSSPPSPSENGICDGQESVKRLNARKRSLDASTHETDDSGTVVIRRRTQRSPSAGSINGIVGPAASKEKLSSEITSMIGQNGFKHEPGPNGVKFPHGYQNGTRPLCCLGLDSKTACSKCMAYHHPTANGSLLSSSLSALSSASSQPMAPSVPLSCQNGRGGNHSNSAGGVGVLPRSTTTSVFSVGSISHPATDDTDSLKRPQPPLSLLPISVSSFSSSAATASQQQQLHQRTQGSLSSGVGSSNNFSRNGDSKDDLITNAVLALSSKCIPASPNSTVLSLRQRPLSSNNAHKSLSQPASPQASTSSSSKSKSLVSSSSLPSLSTLVAEPSSPGTPSTVQCKWRGCSCDLDASDLLEHIRKHVEAQIEKKTYACLWTDCKVFNKPSWSGSWLERHIVSHSGHRPFKCILDNCGQRFHSQAALERHVNGHFTATSQNGAKSGRTRDEISSRMLQKRKRQLKRRFVQTVKRNDFFDEQTMAVIKHELVSLTEQTELDLFGNTLQTTFQGLIVGRRCTKTGSKHSLVEFTPNEVLEDKWIDEEKVHQISKMSIPLSCLPVDTVTNLNKSLYRQHRFRKHRRK